MSHPNMTFLPKFDDLPVKDMPQGCSWGIFDRNNEKDVLGTPNLLTPEVIKDAATEVRQGISISLNWPIGSIKIPSFFRKSLCHNVMKLEDPASGCHFGFDDEVEFNTQASSQWDSFAHFTHLPTGLVYNGAKPTIDAFQTPEVTKGLPTLDHWHQHGCVTRRGVLIGFKSYAQTHQITYDQFSSFRIGSAELEAVAAWQGLTFRAEDILLIRFSVTETLGQMTGAEQGAALSSGKMCGLGGSKEITG